MSPKEGPGVFSGLKYEDPIDTDPQWPNPKIFKRRSLFANPFNCVKASSSEAVLSSKIYPVAPLC
ncbi:MAG: hypothetical protein CM1200mP8_0630 [Chloroflexota bacterium]|nr:MAG: hypothetical protein CM1200mP8_0630 [Chloroflexota bacterium]